MLYQTMHTWANRLKAETKENQDKIASRQFQIEDGQIRSNRL